MSDSTEMARLKAENERLRSAITLAAELLVQALEQPVARRDRLRLVESIG